MLEQRLDDQNYYSLTKPTKGKKETKILNDVLITDEGINTDINLNNDDNIIDNDNNRSNERTIYGDEERITSITKKPIYTSYKDACMNNTITHRKESITHAGTDNATKARQPPVTSE